MKRLYRSRRDRVVAGVAAGMAEYFNVDPVLVRLIWFLLLLPGGAPGLFLYIVCWIIIPREPLADAEPTALGVGTLPTPPLAADAPVMPAPPADAPVDAPSAPLRPPTPLASPTVSPVPAPPTDAAPIAPPEDVVLIPPMVDDRPVEAAGPLDEAGAPPEDTVVVPPPDATDVAIPSTETAMPTAETVSTPMAPMPEQPNRPAMARDGMA